MARRRPNKTSAGRQTAGDSDSLGKLLKIYRPNLWGCIFVTGLGLLVGLMGFAFAVFLSGNPIVIGIAVLAAIAVLIGTLLYSIINYRQCLELRKGGVRFRKGNQIVEMDWNLIIDIQVGRSNLVGYGPIKGLTRSEDPESEENGSYTHSFWEVTLVDEMGQSIYLNQMFLGCVNEPRKLIGNLRKGSGLQTREMRRY